MARITMPSPEEMTPEQAAACDEVIKGPRGKVPVPMIAWLHNPELARRLQKLGELLRFETSLSAAETELAILVCARHWTSHVEWRAHKALALKAGLDPRIPAAIAARQTPEFQDERTRTVFELCSALLESGRISDSLYQKATGILGERGVVELIAIAGYYCLAAFTLNTFELGLPEMVAPELDDPQFSGGQT